MSKRCRICGVELTEENWFPSSRRKKDYICKKCSYKKNKPRTYKWRKKNYQKWREYQNKWNREHKDRKREWNRRHHLTTKGGKSIYGLNKRPYPKDGCCELCGRKVTTMDYHHWDDNHLDMGMWLCKQCHRFAEVVEQNGEQILRKYKQLKQNIEREWLKE